MAKEMYQATGRRKSSIARVRLLPGTGRIVVNKKDLEDYFGLEVLKNEVKRPFEITGTAGKYDVIALVNGGGTTGQAGALRHGISRALCEVDAEANRPALKAAGFLTRDPRMKERKKYGLKKARRASQFSKRSFHKAYKPPNPIGLRVFSCKHKAALVMHHAPPRPLYIYAILEVFLSYFENKLTLSYPNNGSPSRLLLSTNCSKLWSNRLLFLDM